MFVFATQIAGAGLAFLLQMFLARLIGANEYGVYIYAITIVNFLVGGSQPPIVEDHPRRTEPPSCRL